MNRRKELHVFRTNEETLRWVKYLQTFELLYQAEMPNEGTVFLPKIRFNINNSFGCVVGANEISSEEIQFTVWAKGEYDEEFARKSICRRLGFDFPYTLEFAAPRYLTFLKELDNPVLGLANWQGPLQVAIWYCFARQIEVERELRMFFEFLYEYGERIAKNTPLVLRKHALNPHDEIDYSIGVTLIWYDLPESLEEQNHFSKFYRLIEKPRDVIREEIKRIFKMDQRANAFASMFGQKNILNELHKFSDSHYDKATIMEELISFKQRNDLDGWGLKTLCCILQQAFRNPYSYPIDSLIRRISQTAFGMKGNDERIWEQALDKFEYPALVEPLLYENAQSRLLICGEDGEKGCSKCNLKNRHCPRFESKGTDRGL
jgi:endonuclease III